MMMERRKDHLLRPQRQPTCTLDLANDDRGFVTMPVPPDRNVDVNKLGVELFSHLRLVVPTTRTHRRQGIACHDG